MNQFEEVPPGARLPGLPVGGFGAAGKCLGALPPRVRQGGLVWSGTSVLWSEHPFGRRAQYKSGQLKHC